MYKRQEYRHTIVLANVNGKLRELFKTVTKSCTVSFLTMASHDGRRTYRRSVTLLMQKAVENLWGDKVKVRVYYSLGGNYYCELKGRKSDAGAISAIREEMKRLVQEDLPIEKKSYKTTDAEELFRVKGMKDKERLLHYRRSSRVNIYSIDGMEDYYYGYMVPSTGCLGMFDIEAYEEGFVLLLPGSSGDAVEPLSTCLLYTSDAADER